jgi:hypothetical protein
MKNKQPKMPCGCASKQPRTSRPITRTKTTHQTEPFFEMDMEKTDESQNQTGMIIALVFSSLALFLVLIFLGKKLYNYFYYYYHDRNSIGNNDSDSNSYNNRILSDSNHKINL